MSRVQVTLLAGTTALVHVLAGTVPDGHIACILAARVRVRKSGFIGTITKQVVMLGERYIEVTTDNGHVIWPLHLADVEPLQGASDAVR